MNYEFNRSFEKSLDKIKDDKLRAAIAKVIIDISEASAISKVKNIKKLTGYKSAYRVKILSDYRLGLIYHNSIVYIVDFAHRKDIYKKFP